MDSLRLQIIMFFEMARTSNADAASNSDSLCFTPSKLGTSATHRCTGSMPIISLSITAKTQFFNMRYKDMRQEMEVVRTYLCVLCEHGMVRVQQGQSPFPKPCGIRKSRNNV